MNQRRGYCLSAAIIALDLLLTPFGGWLAAVASLVWAGGLGEWAARKKLGAVPCTGGGQPQPAPSGGLLSPRHGKSRRETPALLR